MSFSLVFVPSIFEKNRKEMSEIEQKATVTVDVNGQLAEEKIGKLKKRASDLRDALAEAYKVNDAKMVKKLEAELKSTNTELKTFQKNATNIDQVMKNLSSSGPKELRKTLNDINRELNSGRIKRGTTEWRKYNEQAKLVSIELRKIKTEQLESMTFMERFNNGLSKWGGTITSVLAGLTGVTFALNKMRKDRDDKEESADNLKALTGLDDNSIAWLTHQAEILSTTMDKSGLRIKQSSKDILEAYMLVGSAKPELLTNKEALNTVTIEAMRLAAAAKIDLKEAVEAVTLSMNQYSAGSDQAAKFTNILAAGSKYGSANVQSQAAAIVKSGVAAAGANVHIEQLVGSIEMLGEKGIKNEIAGTGLKKFFLVLQTGVKETNPAIVGFDQALDNLEKKHMSPAQMKKLFGEEGYNVAKVLIDNVAKVKEYTKAVTDTNIAIEQAAINSGNNAAKMTQMKNKLREVGIELMEKLNPSFNVLGSYFTNLIKILPPFINFLQKHGVTIVYLSSVVGTYIAAKKLATLWETKYRDATVLSIAAEKLKTYWVQISTAKTLLYSTATFALKGNMGMAKEAVSAFFRALKLDPLAIAITLITTLAYGIYKLSTYTSEADKAMNDFMAENIQVQNELRKTYKALINTADGTLARTNMIKEFNSKYGEYLPNLLSEKSTLDEIEKAYRRVSIAMQTKLAQQILEEKTNKIERDSMDKKAEELNDVQEILAKGLTDGQLQKVMPKIVQYVNELLAKGYSVERVNNSIVTSLSKTYDQLNLKMKNGGQGYDLISDIKRQLPDYIKIVKKSADKIEEVKKKLNPFTSLPPEKTDANELPEVVITPAKVNMYEDPNGEEKKKRIKQWEAEVAEFKAHTTSLYAIGRLTKQEYDDSIIQSDKDLLQKKMTLYDKHSKEYNDLLIQLKQLDVKTQEDCTKENLSEIDNQISQRKAALFDQYTNETLSKKAYEEGILQLEREALVRKRNYFVEGSKEYNDYQRQIDEFDFKDKKTRQKKYEEKLAAFQKEYRTKSLKELKQKELEDLDTLLKAKLIKVEEYEKLKLAIEKKYSKLDISEKDKERKSENFFDIESDLMNAQISDSKKNLKDLLDKKKIDKDTYDDKIKAIDEIYKHWDKKQTNILQEDEDENLWTKLFGTKRKGRKNTLHALKEVNENGLGEYKDYLQNKGKLDGEYYADLANKAQAAYAIVSSVVATVSEYSQACQDLETAKINKKYDAEIKAAGKNSREVKRLEEKKEKELAKVKSKYANRTFGMNVAMGLAQTAIAAISAYSSALQIGPAGLALAPIAAGMAIATGMIQVATLRKQQEAAKQGYYFGGFTPSGRWDEEQGTVHSGEFVANRFAVQNKEIFPVLRLIDNAQKNNTVGTLRATDVSRVLNQTSREVDSPAMQNSLIDTYQVLQLGNMIERTERTLDRLTNQLDEGIEAHSILDGEQGQIKAKKRYDKLIKNKNRA